MYDSVCWYGREFVIIFMVKAANLVFGNIKIKNKIKF